MSTLLAWNCLCWARAKEPHSVQLCVHTEQSCFGFLAGQGCDAFANLFLTPTLTLNLNTSAYRPHGLQVLEACGGTVDTDKLRSANFAQRTSLSELRSANFAPRTPLRELRSANFAPSNSELLLRAIPNFAPRTSLRELRSANFALRASASMFTRLEHGREPPRPQQCPIYLRAVFQCGRRWS